MNFIFQLILHLLYKAHATSEKTVYYSLKQNETSSTPKQIRNNYAVILSTSTYFHNYRHTSNAASIYHTLKSLGNVPDENIILMIAADTSVDNRNVYKHTVKSYIPKDRASTRDSAINTFHNIDIDYRGQEVTPELFRRILLGKQDVQSRSLLNINENDNILIYMTGHGGDQFFKFHDQTEMTSVDIANIIHEMKLLKRFKNMMWIVDTCQAFTLQNDIDKQEQDDTSVIFVGSSLLNENSYAYSNDPSVGQSIMDRFTKWFVEYMWKQKDYLDRLFLKRHFLDYLNYSKLHSTIGVDVFSKGRDIDSIQIKEFFKRDVDYGELLSLDDAIDFYIDGDGDSYNCNC